MKRRLNDGIVIHERKISENKKELYAIKDNRLIHIDCLYEDDHYQDRYDYDSNYLVTYSQSIYDPEEKYLNRVYDIKEQELVDLDEYTEKLFENMFLKGKSFSFRVVASALRGIDLIDGKKTLDLMFYMSSNQEVLKEEVISEILFQYPELSFVINYDFERKGIKELLDWVIENENKYENGIILTSIHKKIENLKYQETYQETQQLTLT